MVANTDAALPLYANVCAFMRQIGCPLPRVPPLSLVEEGVLNEATRSEAGIVAGHQHHHHDPKDEAMQFHTRGLCLSEYSQQVSESFQTDAMGRRVGPVRRVSVGARVCDVTAILVLSGLPRLLTGMRRT
jgi:hypothetical protein